MQAVHQDLRIVHKDIRFESGYHAFDLMCCSYMQFDTLKVYFFFCGTKTWIRVGGGYAGNTCWMKDRDGNMKWRFDSN